MTIALETKLQELKQQADHALRAYESELDKIIDTLNTERYTDLTNEIILLHKKVMEYHARHESLYEKLGSNRIYLNEFWLCYLEKEPKKDFGILFPKYLNLVNKSLACKRINPHIWQEIFSTPEYYLDITRGLAWEGMDNEEKILIIDKYKSLNVYFSEFHHIERERWLRHRSNVRILALDVFKTSSLIDAFLVDFFPDVYKNLSRSMEISDKLTSLFTHVDTQDIVKQIETHVDRVSKGEFRRIVERLMGVKK